MAKSFRYPKSDSLTFKQQTKESISISKFDKKDIMNIISFIDDFLEKLNKIQQIQEQLNTAVMNACLSDSLTKVCRKIMAKDFKSEDIISEIKPIVLSYKNLFGNLYFLTKFSFIFVECEFIKEKYGSFLLSFRKDAQCMIDKFMWTFATSAVKDDLLARYEQVKLFITSDSTAKIYEYFDILMHNTIPTDDELWDAYIQYANVWCEHLHTIVDFDYLQQSNYVGNAKLRLDKFNNFTNEFLSEGGFEYQIEQYRKYVKRLIELETLKEVVVDIYQELEKFPIDEINKDKSGFRVNSLRTNGFNTLADIYRTNIVSLSAIRGISKDTAFKIKHKVDEIAKMLQVVKHERGSLQLNYDNHSEYVTNIVRAIYSCRKLLAVRKKWRRECFDSGYEVSDISSFLPKFNYDIDWLFYPDDIKRDIISTYRYLGELKDSVSYKLYLCFDKYKFNISNFVDENIAWDDFRDNSVAYYTCIEILVPNAFEDATFGYGLPEELAEQIEKQVIYPKGLTCELRPYQIRGVKYILHQGRALLGDEMGLGKTIQAIASMVSLRNVGYKHFMVICPASVIINWFKEIRQHSKLQSYIGHGSIKDRNDAVNQWKYDGGVLITTYETYANLDIDNFDEIGLVTVDEAHYIKNEYTNRSKHVRELCKNVERVLFLTGTPIENKVDEMLSILSVLNKDVANEAQAYAKVATSQQFQNVVAPVYFRRKQCDVNRELPAKIEKIAWCEMGSEEIKAYDAAALNAGNPFMPMRQVSWNLDVQWSSKAKMLQSIVDEMVADNRKVIVFSFFKQPIERICQLFAGHCTEPIDGSLLPARRQEIIDEFTNNPELWVLPSQIQAGGTGLNIQAASVIVMCEPQVKPSIENQAIARAHRMGQSRTVIVYKLCCKDSIDERMLEILEHKKEEFEVFADKSVSGDKSLDLKESDAMIQNAIAEEIRIIKARNGIKSDNDSFKNSVDGQKWKIEQDAIAEMQYKKIENCGRQRTVSASQRYRILNRDNFTCQKCGAKGPSLGGSAELEVDHKIPFSLGGSDDDSNLWTLCSRCNSGKSNKYID